MTKWTFFQESEFVFEVVFHMFICSPSKFRDIICTTQARDGSVAYKMPRVESYPTPKRWKPPPSWVRATCGCPLCPFLLHCPGGLGSFSGSEVSNRVKRHKARKGRSKPLPSNRNTFLHRRILRYKTIRINKLI